jgi:septum formation protein
VILASASPRRQQFLRALGLCFAVEVAGADERARAGESPLAMVVRLSRAKAEAVAGRNGATAVVAADTVVVLDGRMLGKPADGDEAVAMLRALRGRMHEVYTAVTVAGDGARRTSVSLSQVWMRDYSEAEIAAYVATGDPLDKAGAYAIQHPAFSPVERCAGCYTGIMGLPLGLLAERLDEAGIAVPNDVRRVCESFSGRCCLRGAPPELFMRIEDA